MGKKLSLVLSLILSLSYFVRSVKASEINEFNLCTERHCKDCADDEFFKCSTSALSNLWGDLCGCCHSCVQFRDYGKSCGSQLAVRSSKNIQDSRSRVTILATTSCKKGLICKNFTCKKLKKVIFENNDENSLELRTNLIMMENSNELELNIDEIPSTREKLSTSQSQKNKIFVTDYQHDVKKMENILFNPSGHLINLLVGGKEFQVIYGHEPLNDFNLLIDSIDKNHSNLIINEFEAKILYEHFKEVLQFVDSKTKSSNNEKIINSSSTSLKIENQFKNEIEKIPSMEDSGMMEVLRNFVLIPRTKKISRLRSPVRKFRKKRELDEIEKTKDKVEMEDSKNTRQINEKIHKEFGKVSIYDIVNKTPKPMEDLDDYMITRKIEINPDEKSRVGKLVNGDGIESEINIHITGVPRVANSNFENIEGKHKNFVRLDEKITEEYENYENSEIFADDSNTESSELSTIKDSQKLSNITSEISQNQTNLESDTVDNIDENIWTNYEKSQFFNNYEFPFPENPITLESDLFRDFDNFINETVNEFRYQLDRIETKTMDIESVLYDMMEKIDERSKNIEDIKPKTQYFEIDSEKKNEFEEKFITPVQSKINHFSNEYSTSPRSSVDNPENKDLISDGSKLGEFFPNRLNRKWTTFTIQPNLPEVQKNLRSQRYRANQSRENKSEKPEVASGEDKLTNHRENSDQRNEESQRRRSSSINFSKNLPKASGKRQFPTLLSTSDSSKDNFYNYQQEDPQLFSRRQSNFEITSDSQQHRSGWPLNLILNRALSADRRSRKNQGLIRNRQRNLELENPAEKSVILLETQIPKSILRSRDSMNFGDRMGESSMRFVTNYGDGDDWNWGDEKPSLNLFVVDGENSEFDMSRSELQKTLGLPMENIRMETNNPEAQEIDENYHVFPPYLDYSDRLENNEKDDKIVKLEKTESTENPVKNKPVNSRNHGRKERSLNDFSEIQNFEDTNEILQLKKTINSSLNESSLNSLTQKSEKSEFSLEKVENYEKNSKKLENSQKTDNDLKNGLKKRSERSVQMVDWLRAAQEYHERIRQIKNAAMKTWLASKEELDNTNLTNVKLFTREIPAYLERYRPDFENDYLNLQDDENQEIRRQKNSIPDFNEVLTDILAEQTLPEKNEPEMDATNDGQLTISEISNLKGPKKFTIITSGNSTIRIEEIFDNEEDDDQATWFEDESSQDSTGSETYKIPITISAGDYFDHMYESVDADDEEFDYEDPNLAMSGWLDQIEVIDPSSVEVPSEDDLEIEKIKDENFDSEEDEDPLNRFKRDSPLFLFKIKGNPQHDVLVWPSHWKDLIDRHLRLNRTKDSSQGTTTTKPHLKLKKIDSNLESSTTIRTNIDEDQTNRNDEIYSSSENIVKIEKSSQESSADLDIARKLRENSFDHRTRQNRRKNGVYRANTGNYR